MSTSEKLQTVAENQPKVYESGKKSEHDAFWDSFQDYGNRTAYDHAFRGPWDATTFKPKYDIKLVGAASSAFAGNGAGKGLVGDLQQMLDDCGVTLDTSEATRLDSMFYNNTGTTRVGAIDTTGATNIAYLFEWASSLKTIEKLILKSDGSQDMNIFNGTVALENVTIEGVIGKNGLNMRHATKLSRTSIASVVNALSTTTSGLSITLSQTAVKAAYSDSDWTALANTRSNWTISLV